MVVKPFYATGRRKTAQARVFAYHAEEGNGAVVVNNLAYDDYFPKTKAEEAIRPLFLVEKHGALQVKATLRGGGISAQAGALSLGISRVLEKIDPSLRTPLKKEGLLSRDSREVERKKPGRHKARKSTQFSKR